MKIIEAQQRVDAQIQSYGGYWRKDSMFLRLIEEVGELARAINIKYGDKKSKSVSDGGSIEKELSDVFYTTIALVNSNNIKLDISNNTIEELQTNFRKNNHETNKLSVLRKLMIKIGSFSKYYSDDNNDLTSSISDIIITIIKIATILDVDLSKEFDLKVSNDESKMKRVYGDK